MDSSNAVGRTRLGVSGTCAVEGGLGKLGATVFAAAANDPVAKVRILGPDSPELHDLGALRGPLYESWLGAWRKMSPAERDPLTHPAWMISWFVHQSRSRGRDVRLFVISRERGAGSPGLLTLLPCEVVRRRLGCALVLLTDVGSSSIALAQHEHEDVLEALFRTPVPGVGRPRSLHLWQVDASNALLDVDWPRVHARGEPRSFLDVDGAYERLSRKLRTNLRSADNRLRKLEDVHIDTLTERGKMAPGLERVLDVEVRSWKRGSGRLVRDDLAHTRMLEIALTSMGGSGEAVIHLLRVQGRDIACHVGLMIEGTLYGIMMSYDESYARFSPGAVLFKHILTEFCPQRGVRRMNFVTDPGWSQRWRARQLDTRRLWLLARGWRGVWARWADVPCRASLERMLAKLGLETHARELQRTVCGQRRQATPTTRPRPAQSPLPSARSYPALLLPRVMVKASSAGLE